MTSPTDDDGTEEFVQADVVPIKKVQAKYLKSGRLLGKGSSSIVYETTWKGKSYARKDFLRVPSGIFEREAAVLVGLDDHPNVVRTYCWTVDEGSCSLVIELMDDDLLNMMQNRKDLARKKFPGSGSSDASQTSHVIDLHRFIEDGKNAPVSTASKSAASTLIYHFSMPEALHIMLQIAEGIVFLHENGVAHGNLKPKNILVTPSGRPISGSLDQNVAFKLKVADFGLVRTKTKSKTLVSRQAQKLELVRWRAPELLDMNLLREDEHESFTDSDWDSDSSDGKDGGSIHKFTYGKLSRADVYSFAVICSQILTGEDPYSGLGLNDLVSKISGPDGLRPELPRRCPTQLRDLINRCWGEELNRPNFIDILSELKDLQASLTADSWVDIRKATFTRSFEDIEFTVSLKYFSEKIAKNQYIENPGRSANAMVRTLPRGPERTEEGGLPIKSERHSIKYNEEGSKLTSVPKKRRRRKVYGCLGSPVFLPAKTISSKENEDILTPTTRSTKNAGSRKNPFGKATSEPFSPNDKRYNAEIGRTVGAKPYTPAEVTAMTRNFKTEIGNGGFGHVYYGKLSDGQEVAVKVGSSPQLKQEFFNEIDLLSRVRHKNLVALMGYCQKKKHHILIYEYMKNGSLHDHLYGSTQRAGMLDWKTRLQIALNVAQGLEYLHTGCEPSFVHGDIKSSNVLLSAKYDAKLTDFGLTKLMGEEVIRVLTQPIKGTPGYLDPEYFRTYVLSPKSDIFSFGVVLLELITGRPPFIQSVSSTSRESLCDWVRGVLQEGNIDMILDLALKSSVPAPNHDALWKVAAIAIRCVEPKGVHRPTMSDVVQELRDAMNLEGSLEQSILSASGTIIITEPSIKQTAPPKPISSSGNSWKSEYFTKQSFKQTEPPKIFSSSRISWQSEYLTKPQREKPDWDSSSRNIERETHVLQKRRRRKFSNWLERFGCISAKAVSMGKGNEDVSTTATITHRSRLRRRAQKSIADNVQNLGRSGGAKTYTFAEVTTMTRNFKTKIGKGGFGPVYYGKLPYGQEVAVKVGNASTSQGDQEFFNEIDILSRVHHKNLVSLVGYCLEDKYNILIYEYMQNGSLHDHLYGSTQRAGMLDWKTRLQIALNVAQGLDYLHTGCSPQLIHRDVKSKNILLSAKDYAKVADFGLSRLMGVGISNSPVMTQVMGTPGYLDPEYFLTNYLSSKSDIFSFGVVLLELITGRPPVHRSTSMPENYHDICVWVRGVLQEGNIDMILDLALKSSVPAPNKDALWKVAEIAIQCVEPKGVHRPTMSKVVQELRDAMILEESLAAPFQESLPASSEAPLDYYLDDPETVSEILTLGR